MSPDSAEISSSRCCPCLDPVLATLIGLSSEKGGGCTRWVTEAATMKLPPPHTHLEGTALAAVAGERSSLQS